MSQCIDYDNLDLLKSVIGKDLKSILESYLKITPDVLDKLREAIAQKNDHDVQHYAHTLKGSSSNIGAIEVPAVSLKLEDMGRHGKLDQAEVVYAELQDAYQRLTVAIADYIQKI